MSDEPQASVEARGLAGAGLPLLLGVTAGAIISMQSFSNARLSDELDSWIAPAVLNNLLAFSLLLAVAIPTGSLSRFRESFRRQRPPTWTIVIGANGAFYVTVMAGLAARVGVAAMTLAGVFGQLLASTALDHLGVTPGGRRRISPLRIIGLLLAAAAVGLGLFSTSSESWLVVFGAVAGVGFVFQQVGLGRLREHTGEPVSSALAQIGVGAGVLLVLFVLVLPIQSVHLAGVSPEYCFGGLLAAVVIVIVASTISLIGAFGLILSVTIGQTMVAVGLDAAFPVVAGVSLTVRLVSVALLIVAVVLNEVSRRQGDAKLNLAPPEGGVG